MLFYLFLTFSVFTLYYSNRYIIFFTLFPVLLSSFFYSLIMYYEIYCIRDDNYREIDYNCNIVKFFILNAPSYFSDKFIFMYSLVVLINIIYIILEGFITLFRICLC